MTFQRTIGWHVFALWMAIAAALAPGLSAADEQTALTAPQKVIQETSDRLQLSLQRPEIKNDFTRATSVVDSIIEPHIDFDRVSVMVLGKYWKTATPDQKSRFKNEFRRLLVRTYTTAFTEYANWKIRYLPTQGESGADKTMVRTEILQAGAQPVAVNYRMVNAKGTWKVFDVLIEGISLLQNYRTSFTHQIAEGGSVEQLIKDLALRNDTAHKEPLESGSAKGS